MLNPVQNKIISVASNANPSAHDLKKFEPSVVHEAIAGALNSTECPHTLTGLATHAGVDPKTLRKVLRDPAAVLWIVTQATTLAEARLGAVHSRIFNMAMTSRSASWAKLYMERFDREYKTQKVMEKGGAHQFNFLKEMAPDELRTLLQRKLQQLQGPATGSALLSHGDLRGVPGPTGDGVRVFSDWIDADRDNPGSDDEG